MVRAGAALCARQLEWLCSKLAACAGRTVHVSSRQVHLASQSCSALYVWCTLNSHAACTQHAGLVRSGILMQLPPFIMQQAVCLAATDSDLCADTMLGMCAHSSGNLMSAASLDRPPGCVLNQTTAQALRWVCAQTAAASWSQQHPL